MVEILIARHGQSMGDIENRYEGRADLTLSDLGREQADKLGVWLKSNYTPARIMSSPLKRASETAQIIGSKIGLNVNYNDALMELDSGLIAGLDRKEADIKYPRPTEPLMPHEPICTTGESLLDFRFRAEKFLSKLICEYEKTDSYQRILLVSHGAMINMMLQCFLKLPMTQDMIFRLYDTGLHLIRVSKTRVVIDFLNSTAHLM